MGEYALISYFETSKTPIILCRSNEPTEAFHKNQKEESGEWASLVQPSFNMKKVRCRAIDQDNERGCGDETHNPINEGRGETHLGENHFEIDLAYQVKGFF